MPVIVAVGVNLGIVPLLFVQLAYYKVFYPATILMAWFWLAIIGLLIPAYYGVYAYAWGIRNDASGMAGWRMAAGWCAAVFFIAIGFLFANGLSLMDHVGRWPELWKAHSMAGAALGTALNVGDATLWPRWLLMFGLALGTTAVWVLVDTFWLNHKDRPTKPIANGPFGFARKLYTLGMVWAAAAGTMVRLRHMDGRSAENHVPMAAAGVDRRHGDCPRPALAADDDGRTGARTSVPRWPRSPSASWACWGSTPSAGKSCRTST